MTDKLKADYKSLDPVQDAMGSMGRWQIIIAVALSLINFPAAWRQLSNIFMAPNELDFTCESPSPMNPNATMLKACSIEVANGVNETCTNFTYDTSVFQSTIISKWDLVCEREDYTRIVQITTMVGILVGNMVFSVLADRIGRKIPLMIAVISQSILGMLSTFMPYYSLFLVCTIISSIATGGTMLISFVIIMEVIGTEWRSKVAVLFHLPFLLGILSLSLISYLTRTWDGLLLTVSLPPILLLSYYWVVPESPRWLLAVGKVEQARKILMTAARKNGISEEKVNLAIELHESQRNKDTDANTDRKYTLLDLFRTPNMRTKTICLVINWFTCGIYFFGMNEYVSTLGGSIFTNVAISGAIQLPSVPIVYILISRVSRLRILIGGNIVAGVCSLLVIVSSKTLQVVFASIGLCGIAVCFTTIYLYSGEVFPTVVRNAGFGLCSVSSRIGSMIAPYIPTLKVYTFWLPPLMFAIGPLISATLCIFLPETMNCTLPETIEDGENFKRKKADIPLETVN